MSYLKTEELFDKCAELAATEQPSVASNRCMHETLVLCCAEGLKDSGQAYGNLFSQVDYLCKRHGVSLQEKIAIQTMRRHSNSSEALSREELMYDVRALSLFISAVFGEAIPDRLVRLIPTEGTTFHLPPSTFHHLRCIVSRWDDRHLYVETDKGEMVVDCVDGERGIDHTYLSRLVREGMQLNLLDVRSGCPGLIVVEPDFLVDISSIAACFTDYGHHPLLFTLNRLKERANTQPILLGNFAGRALDSLINQTHDFATCLTESFREQALQFCTLEAFQPEQFVSDARQQVANLEEVVNLLFSEYDRDKAILEPSFVCERLGLQGRVDLMTTDMRLLVEQKSGKNMKIERQRAAGNPQAATQLHREDHYVQLLLYYGILRHNFGVSDQKADIRLLYSRYPAREGLLVVNFYQQLFREAIKFRNQLVATEYHIARQGFGSILPHLNARTVYGDARRDTFFTRYIEPQVTSLTSPLLSLTPIERAYYTRMMTFVYREQLYAKVGSQEGKSSAIADLWNMPLSEKRETGNIYTDLRLTDRRKSSAQSGYDLLTFTIPDQGTDFLPNFRRGDMVCVYAYREEPDITRSILYKGTIREISTTRLLVRLADGQQNPDIFQVSGEAAGKYAVEHGTTEMSTGSNIRSLQAFISGPADKRSLLLGQRSPVADTTLTLSRSYHPDYDGVVLKALQAQDYFLLVGPPGTGKTSMALRFLVTEHTLSPSTSTLISSFTNRAVDEICGMLEDAGFDYLRLGSEETCDPRYRHRLLDHQLGGRPKLDDIRRRIQQVPIIVSTTSMLQARPFIFQLKQFSLAIIDEASQILEPNLVGLLTKMRKFILIGDYKQLPAVVQQPERESTVVEPCLREIGLTDCRQSLFERLIRWEEQCGRSQFVGILRKQGRMHPDIAAFPNRMFYFREQLEPVPCPHQLDTTLGYDLPSEDALDDRLKEQRMIFLDTNAEATVVADLLRRIHRFYGDRFDASRTVGVIVPYRNQIAMIRRETEKLGIPVLSGVSIDTVERYQGSQRDVIIYSFSVSYSYQLDFLTSSCFEQDGHTIDRRLNVAITRARKQMILTGCEQVLRQNPIFSELIDFCQ